MPPSDRIVKEHAQLVEAIEAKLHINLYEHRYSLVRFVGTFVIFAALGTVSGGLLDKLMNRIQGTTTDKGSCAKFLFVNVVINGFSLYLLLTLKRTGLQFDDWLMGTFNGFIFALTLFNAQEKLTKNMQCLIL